MKKEEQQQQQQQPQQRQDAAVMKMVLLIFNCFLLAVGNCGSLLVLRLYFVHGGKRIWLSSWLQTGAWPIIFIPLTISYFYRRGAGVMSLEYPHKTKVMFMKPWLFLAAAAIGFIIGFDNYLYAYSVSRLPVSTFSLVISCQLAFTAGFAYLLVKQKFTSYSINAIILLTMGGAVLALQTNQDRPIGESTKQYIIGFLTTVGAAMLYGFVLPLVELTYKKARQQITYTLVLEFQLIISLFATIVCTIGMLINKDFQVIPREAMEFELGETKYYVVLACSAVVFQCFFLGAIGVIFCSSSLFSGVLIATLMPVIEIMAVLIFKEKFHAIKGVSLALNIWGFISYFYGEIKHNKKKKKKLQLQLQQTQAATQITNV